MIIVIQCAGTKNSDCCGCMQTREGKRVMFVADPKCAPRTSRVLYRHPDDKYDSQQSWRDRLVTYNKKEKVSNPWRLCSAYQLYKNPIYARLEKSGHLYILSAGWGLISADFLLPYYDITFSQTKKEDEYKRRLKKDHYDDFQMLPPDNKEPIAFFGSAKYVPLFCCLTQTCKCKKTVFYKSKYAPEAPGCRREKYNNAKRDMNWQYDCAEDFLDGKIDLG
jgi:hypothetical protein